MKPPTLELERLPANDLAERSILGACLMAEEAMIEAEVQLRPEEFYSPANRVIFAAMCRLSRRGVSIDFVTLDEELRRSAEIDTVGGSAYMVSLTDGLPRSVNLNHYIGIVRERHRRRQILDVARRAFHDTLDDTQGLPDVLDALEGNLLQIRSDDRKPTAQRLGGAGIGVLEQIEAAGREEPRATALSTGLSRLDVTTGGGIRSGELWIVGAWPGMGKSAFALGMALANAAAGVPVGMFSLEMTRDQLMLRTLSRRTGINCYLLRKGMVTAAERDALVLAAADIAAWPLYVDESGSLSLSELLARARLYIRRYGVRMLIVDYLQLIRAEGDERSAVTRISGGLRELAKSEQVAVVALSQLARPANKERPGPPSMFALKESGSLEADAHAVLLLWREQRENGLPAPVITVAKQRSGPTGDVAVRFLEDVVAFEDKD